MKRILYSKKIDGHCINFQLFVTTNGKAIECFGPFAGDTWNQDKWCIDMMSNNIFLADISKKGDVEWAEIFNKETDQGIFHFLYKILKITIK